MPNKLSLTLIFLLLSATDACMRVTPGNPGMPATPCKSCAKSLMSTMPANTNSGQKAMDGDVTVTTGACAVRKLTCNGVMASIQLFGSGNDEIGSFPSEATNTISTTVTCNAAGTAWVASTGAPVIRAECSVVLACRMCSADQITVVTTGAGVQPMEDDQITYPECQVRTFTCMGNMAAITVATANGPIAPVGDGGTGTATLAVTCAADGSGWTNAQGQKITQVSCTTVAAAGTCKSCTKAQLSTMPLNTNAGEKEMDTDDIDLTGACAMRTVTCMGLNPSIEFFDTAGISLGQIDGGNVATYTFACNADGTAWTAGDAPDQVTVKRAVCGTGDKKPCKTCTDAQITVIDTGAGIKAMDADITTFPDCAVRTFTCIGNMASIMIWTANGMIAPAGDAGTGTATLALDCAADGSGWKNAAGQTITQVACSTAAAAGTCKSCTQESLVVAPMGGDGAKAFTTDMTDPSGACLQRTLTCVGRAGNTFIEIFDGTTSIGSLSDAAGTATISVTCKADGSGWEALDASLTRVECSSA